MVNMNIGTALRVRAGSGERASPLPYGESLFGGDKFPVAAGAEVALFI